MKNLFSYAPVGFIKGGMFLTFFGLLYLASCQSDQQAPTAASNTSSNSSDNKDKAIPDPNPHLTLEEFQWLVGDWQRPNMQHGTMVEHWEWTSDTLMTGRVYSIMKTDTTVEEKLQLKVSGREIYYVPDVAHNEGPVPFKLVGRTRDKVVFENPGHDFPQRIIYTRFGEDSLLARIEGMSKGELKGVDFGFSRMKVE